LAEGVEMAAMGEIKDPVHIETLDFFDRLTFVLGDLVEVIQ
jgi:hypothetical protein